MKRIISIIIGVAVLAVLVIVIALNNGTVSTTGSTASSTGSAEIVGAGARCGGFIRNAPVCGVGLTCELNNARPDTGGVCVYATATSTATSSPVGIMPYNSGIRGTVALYPVCPVEQNPPSAQCAPRPYQTMVAIFRASDAVHAVATLESDASGTFTISLPPGDYTLGAGESAFPRCDHPAVTVGPTGYASTTILCDTGIR